MKNIKRICALVLVVILCVGLFTEACAWSSETPPSSKNISTGTGEEKSFGSNGIKQSITTSKCYTGAKKYDVSANNIYTIKHGTQKIKVTMKANYWNDNSSQWEAGKSYSKELPSTYVKGKVVKQSTSGTVNAQHSYSYHYGLLSKNYTSVYIGGSFGFYKNKD